MVSELTQKELKLSRCFGKTQELKNASQGETSFSSQIQPATFWKMQEGSLMMTLNQQIWYAFTSKYYQFLKKIYDIYLFNI